VNKRGNAVSSSKLLSLPAAAALLAGQALAGPTLEFTPPFDLDGMGDSDILLEKTVNPNDGLLKSLIIQGTAQTDSGFPTNITPEFSSAGGGNLDGDANGQAEIVIRKISGTNTGLVQALKLDGTGIALDANGVKNLTLENANNKFIGIADMDDDGVDDLVFYRASGANIGLIKTVLLNNDYTIKDQGNPGNVPADYSPIGLGDANGDGRNDIWFIKVSGTNIGLVRVFLTDVGGLTKTSGSVFPAQVPANYTFRGIGFYNTDIQEDLLIEKTSGTNTGLVKLLYTAPGGDGTIGSAFPVLLGTDQDVVALGDYDGINQFDILSRKMAGTNPGLLKIHIMNAAGDDRTTSGFPSAQSLDLEVVQDRSVIP
jgi:hypothetical protein